MKIKKPVFRFKEIDFFWHSLNAFPETPGMNHDIHYLLTEVLNRFLLKKDFSLLQGKK